jgi:hypothetical protein
VAKITMGPEYFAIRVEDLPRSFGSYRQRVQARREWLRRIREQFPKFDSKKYRSIGVAKMQAGKIKKAFPDAPIEVTGPMSDIYF